MSCNVSINCALVFLDSHINRSGRKFYNELHFFVMKWDYSGICDGLQELFYYPGRHNLLENLRIGFLERAFLIAE